ncbi:MAG: glycosyltransferase family 2 protein [Patescibacteria group bacterium]
MSVYLITVNYNGAEQTVPFIHALKTQTDTDFHLMVVDNASVAHDMQKIEQALSGTQFKLYKNSSNLGFSGGNNVGIRHALERGAEWVVLLNNDTEPTPAYIERLRANLGQIKGIGALPVREGARTAYGGRIEWLKPTLPHVYDFALSPKLSALRRLYAIGAGMVIHRSVFEKIGLFDERYFLYFEDADFCARAMRAGIPITPVSEPILDHHGSATTRSLGSALLLRYHARNALLFNFNNGPRWVKGLLPFVSLYGIIFQLLKMLLMPSRRAPSRAIAAGILDFYRGRFRKLPY